MELSSFVLLLVLMPVSVLLSYECTVLYFLIKNVYFILGLVKVAKWPSSAITCSCSRYDMLCYLCKRSMLFRVFFFPISASKLLEVHILTTTYQKALILGQVPCRVGLLSTTSDPRVHAHGWGLTSKSSVVFLFKVFRKSIS